MFSEEERKLLDDIEKKQFRASIGMKGLSLFTLMHLRFLWRPVGRPWLFDLSLVYFSVYTFLGSNIPGVFMTWPEYMPLAKRMFESPKLRKRGLRNQLDFLDETNLKPEFKANYYKLEMLFARFY